MVKRGTDHKWEIIRYKGNMALYARCKCGFEYRCSRTEFIESVDGSKSSKEHIAIIYPYCHCCGAKKEFYNAEPEKLDGFPVCLI